MIFAYIFGFLGIVANVLIYQQKSGQKLLALKLTSDVLWAAQYFFLGGYTGMMIAVIAIIREIVFLYQNKKNANRKGYLILFLCAGILSSVFTWKGWFCLLPSAASCIAIFSFWKGKPKLARYLAIPVSLCMLSYDIFCHSVLGICNECLTLSSTAIGIYRFHQKDNK